MRSRWTIVGAVAATCWVAPQLAAAEDVEEQLRRMNERMSQMEDQLEATNEKLESTTEELESSKRRVEDQQALIQDLDADREASSALSKFLSETEFSGLMAASYTYNFKTFNSSAVGRNGSQTIRGENGSVFGIVAPHHQNSNNFQVDQLAFRMKKTPTPESRAGWGTSIAYGSSADALVGRSASDASGDLPALVEAYAAYLWDVGSGVKSTLGRYMFPGGGESFFANENLNVTRGLLWTLQPVNLTGGNLSGELGEAFSWQIGGSNSYGNTMANTDTHPTFVGRVGYRADTLGFGVTGVYGGNVDDLLAGFGNYSPGLVGTAGSGSFFQFDSGLERNGDKIGLLDAVLTWDPSDQLTTWVNFDYYWLAKTGQGTPGIGPGTFDLKDLSIWGIAAAGRYSLTEATGLALRYEYLSFNNFGPAPGFNPNDANLMSLTATLDHHLTDNLVLSAEGRWDRGRFKNGPNRIYLGEELSGPTVATSAGSGLTVSDFTDPNEEGNDHQILGIVQLRYDF